MEPTVSSRQPRKKCLGADFLKLNDDNNGNDNEAIYSVK